MNTITIFLKTFLNNLEYIIPVFGIFLLTGIAGYIFYKAAVKDETEFTAIPAGFISGVLSFILFLSVFSYVFKSSSGIWIILVLYLSAGLVTFRKYRYRFNFKRPAIRPDFIPKSLVYLFFLSVFIFTAGNNIYGGDVIAYWGFATSFANGNYPVHSPWQPDLLAAHHQGAFLYQGAVQALTGVNIKLIHSLFSFMIISAGFFLLWGWVRKQTGRIYLSLFPALVMYISLAAFFIPLPAGVGAYLNPEVNHEVQKLPIMTDFKNRLGGSSNLNELFYINHRSAAFAGLLLIFVSVCTGFNFKAKWIPVFLVFLIIPTISSDEVVLPALGFGLLFWWINQLKEANRKQQRELLIYSVAALAIFIILFFSTGSALRDAMLIPSEQPRFTFITDSRLILKRFNELSGAVLTYKDYGFLLYLPDMRLFAIAALILTIYTKNKWGFMLLAGVAGSLLAMLVTEHTFYPGNHGRFLHLIYILTGLAFAFNLTGIISGKYPLKLKFLSGLIIMILIVPPVIAAQINVIKNAKASEYPNLDGKLPDYKVLKWAKQNIPGKRILFLDGYMKGVSYSYLTLNGIQNYGLMVPVSPAFIKVHTSDFGIEAVDAINTLDPKSLNDLKVEYVFIASDQLISLSGDVREMLKNPRLFQNVYEDDLGKIYFVSDVFKTSGLKFGNRIRDLKTIIPAGSKVYLDAPPRMDMTLRAVLLLGLQDIGQIYSYQSSGHFNYIERKIVFDQPGEEVKYDYLILDPKADPYRICSCRSVEKFWEIPSAVGYKTYE